MGALDGNVAPGGEVSSGEGILSCSLIQGTLSGTKSLEQRFSQLMRCEPVAFQTVACCVDRPQNRTSQGRPMHVACPLFSPVQNPSACFAAVGSRTHRHSPWDLASAVGRRTESCFCTSRVTASHPRGAVGRTGDAWPCKWCATFWRGRPAPGPLVRCLRVPLRGSTAALGGRALAPTAVTVSMAGPEPKPRPGLCLPFPLLRWEVTPAYLKPEEAERPVGGRFARMFICPRGF